MNKGNVTLIVTSEHGNSGSNHVRSNGRGGNNENDSKQKVRGLIMKQKLFTRSI